MAKSPAWTRKEGKNPEGGLNEKGRASLKAAGHDIKRPQPEGGSRKDSFCARMKGMKEKLTSSETANDPDSRINKSLRKWNCRSDGGALDIARQYRQPDSVKDKQLLKQRLLEQVLRKERETKTPSSSSATTPYKPSPITPNMSKDLYERGNLGKDNYALAKGGVAINAAKKISRKYRAFGGANNELVEGKNSAVAAANPVPVNAVAQNVPAVQPAAVPTAYVPPQAMVTSAPAAGPSNDVNNLFKQYLGRDADPNGLEYYSGLLNSGAMTLNDVTNDIINSPERQSYINSQPQYSLPYFPDNPAQESDEYSLPYFPDNPATDNAARVRSDVNNMFKSILGREADIGGLNYYSGLIENGNMSLDDLKNDMYGSQEMKQYSSKNPDLFVTNLFKDVLGRQPDEGGFKYYKDILQQGVDPQSIYNDFINSNEAVAHNTITGYFKDILGREPDQGGLDYYKGQLLSGRPAEDIANEFYNSGEANQLFIDNTAQDLIGSNLDDATKQRYLSQLNNKYSTKEDIYYDISNTPEALAHQNNQFAIGAYNQLTGQDPTPEKLKDLVSSLNKSNDPNSLYAEISKMPEAELYAASNFVPYQVASSGSQIPPPPSGIIGDVQSLIDQIYKAPEEAIKAMKNGISSVTETLFSGSQPIPDVSNILDNTDPSKARSARYNLSLKQLADAPPKQGVFGENYDFTNSLAAMQGLTEVLGVPVRAAKALVSNFMGENANKNTLPFAQKEKKGFGGIGMPQFTFARKKDFLKAAQKYGYNQDSLGANLAAIAEEVKNDPSLAAAIKKAANASSDEEAIAIIASYWEKPGSSLTNPKKGGNINVRQAAGKALTKAANQFGVTFAPPGAAIPRETSPSGGGTTITPKVTDQPAPSGGGEIGPGSSLEPDQTGGGGGGGVAGGVGISMPIMDGFGSSGYSGGTQYSSGGNYANDAGISYPSGGGYSSGSHAVTHTPVTHTPVTHVGGGSHTSTSDPGSFGVSYGDVGGGSHHASGHGAVDPYFGHAGQQHHSGIPGHVYGHYDPHYAGGVGWAFDQMDWDRAKRGGRINKDCGGAVESALDVARAYKKGGAVWNKPRPKSLGKPTPLSSDQKSSAKAMAKAAGRPYPNLVDNMRAAKKD